ncbi:MAG: T9SS type A sorting domain-containing protein, partial [bacterium]
ISYIGFIMQGVTRDATVTFQTDLFTVYHQYDWSSIADIYMQRVDSSGAELCQPGGILLEYGAGQSGSAYLIQADINRFVTGYGTYLVSQFQDIFAQKFDTSGTLLWGLEGVVVCDYPEPQSGVQVAPDGQGGAIFLWDDNRYSVFDDIFGQHLDASGNRLWDPDGVPIVVAPFETYIADILADGEGGVFFTYTDGAGYQPCLGRLNGDGQVLWTVTLYNGYPGYGGVDLATDGEGGVYVVWCQYNEHRIYAHHYSAAGQPLWSRAIPVSNSPGNEDYAEIVSDDAGGFIVVWESLTESGAADNIYAQHVTSGAELLWGLSDQVVCSQGNWQGYPRAIPDGSGGVVASWADWRNPVGPTLYGQRVLSDGILGNFPELDLQVRPPQEPIVIPASGDSFNFQISIHNDFGATLSFDFWTNVLLPNGSNYGPLILRNNVTLGVGSTITRTLTQTIPAGAPAGQYLYRVRVGDHPVAVWDQGSFPFTKLGTGSGGQYACTGWELVSAESESSTPIPSVYSLYPPYPNPFNSTTTIRFDLPVAAQVQLEVFDVNGRNVLSGSGTTPTMYDAGTHEIHFDGSALPSGLYVFRLTAGDWQGSGKMVLLK